MTLFNTLFGSNSRRPSNSARLTVEALEAREVPAVGKWYPAASVLTPPPALGQEAEVRLMNSTANLIDSTLVEAYQVTLNQPFKVEPPPPRPLETAGLIAVHDATGLAKNSTPASPRDAKTGSFHWLSPADLGSVIGYETAGLIAVHDAGARG